MQIEDFDDMFHRYYEVAMAEAIVHEQELWGDAEELPDDEFEIVFSRMAHEDKLDALKVLQALKARGLGGSNTGAC